MLLLYSNISAFSTSKTPFNEFAKQFFEAFVIPLGQVQKVKLLSQKGLSLSNRVTKKLIKCSSPPKKLCRVLEKQENYKFVPYSLLPILTRQFLVGRVLAKNDNISDNTCETYSYLR